MRTITRTAYRAGLLVFFFLESEAPRDLHSFPTRRSSDLTRARATSTRGPTRAPRARPPPASPTPSPAPRSSDRKSTRLNSSHSSISYAVFCLKKKKEKQNKTKGPKKQHSLNNHNQVQATG